MATTITRVGGNLKIDNGTNPKYIPLDDVNVSVVNGTLTISEDRAPKFVTTDPAEVTDPSEATLELLADAIALIASAAFDGVDPTTIVEGNVLQVTVGTASTEIVPANAKRITVRLYNINAKDAFLAIGKAAEIDKGHLITPNTGFLEFPADKFGTDAINAIRSTGVATQISFQEFTKP